jgi:predicted RNA-binding Zn-ribbon protein involved in translation (DUF1610 family)
MAEVAEAKKHFKCFKCGGDMEYDPGASAPKCPYCGLENKIPKSEDEIEELDFSSYLEQAKDQGSTEEKQVVKCSACGAETLRSAEIAADRCPFCGSDLISEGGSTNSLKPKSLLPFKVARKEAVEKFGQWLRGLWFAPNALKKFAEVDNRLNGMYVPFWTYDCDTVSVYRGERGEDYYETEHYTTTENGKTVSKTRQVRKTRWYPASGTVFDNFDDILILASHSLPKKHADELEPWDLENLVPYQDEYLSGFRAENYQIDLAAGFEEAKVVISAQVHETVRRDIGGDRQRIHSVKSQYNHITFKHILLPVWISAYRYGEKTYRFLVNARTGEVQGERPWSWIKIALTVIGAIAAVGAVVYLAHG